MAQYRKKQVVVEAILYDGSNTEEIIQLQIGTIRPIWQRDGHLLIETLEGKMKVVPGDYVIKDFAGEIYPVKPHIFNATYEAVDG